MYKVFVLSLILMISVQVHCFTESHECLDGIADVVFVLDSSTSIRKHDFQKQLQFVNHFIDNVTIGSNKVKVGVVSFSTTVQPNIYLSNFTDKLKLKNSVLNITHIGGDTNTYFALNLLTSTMFITEYGARKNAKNIAYVLTDGVSQNSKATLLAAEKCRKANIELFAIGIGDKIDMKELKGIASEPKENHYLHIANYNALIDKRIEVINKACLSNDEPKPESDCKSTKVIDFVFALNSNCLGQRKTSYILKAVGGILEGKIYNKFRFGMVFDQCPYLQDISFAYEDNSKVQQQIIKYQTKPFYTIFEKLNNVDYLGSLNRRISFVFVDETVDFTNFKENIKKSKNKEIEIYLVAIGSNLNTYLKKINLVPSSHIIFIPSYGALSNELYSEFVKLFCIETSRKRPDLS